MSFLVVLGLFLLKHGLLAHVVDFGYSLSRMQSRTYWFFAMLCHCTMEASISTVVLTKLGFSWTEAAWVLATEFVAMIVSSLVERRAPLRRLLISHVACELGVFAVYASVLFLVGIPPE